MLRRSFSGSRGSSASLKLPLGFTMRKISSSTTGSARLGVEISPVADNLFQIVFARPVRGPDEGAARDVEEAELFTEFAVPVERLRRDVGLDGEVPGRWPQILPEGEDVHARRAEVPHRRLNLVLRLAEAEHDRGLREQAFPNPLRSLQDAEALAVVRAGVPHVSL